MKPSFRASRGLWFIPLACVAAGIALSLCTIAIDKAFDYRLVPQSISGGPPHWTLAEGVGADRARRNRYT